MSDGDFDLSRFKSKKQDRRRVEEIVARRLIHPARPRRSASRLSRSLSGSRRSGAQRCVVHPVLPMSWRLRCSTKSIRATTKGGDIILSAEVTGMKCAYTASGDAGRGSAGPYRG